MTKKQKDTNGLIMELMECVKKQFEGVENMFVGMDKRFEGMDKRFEGMDKRFEGMDKRFDRIDKRLDSQHQVLTLHQKTLEDMGHDVRELREGQLLHDKRFDELDSAVHAVSRAVDKDAVKVIDQGR